MQNNFTSEPGGSIANPFRFLQTGAQALDQLLRRACVPQGSLVHLDFDTQHLSYNFPLALCKTALERGERVVFIYVPNISFRIDDSDEEFLYGDLLEPYLEERTDLFGLDSALNHCDLASPNAKFRHLTAHTCARLEATLDGILQPCDSDQALPDHIILHGVDQLFQHLPLDPVTCPRFNEAGEPLIPQISLTEEEEVLLVQEEHARLRHWIKTYSALCQKAGINMYWSGSHDFYAEQGGSTLFTRSLRQIFYNHCHWTLFVEERRGNREANEVSSQRASSDSDTFSVTLAVSLFAVDALQGLARVPVVVNQKTGQVMGYFAESGTPNTWKASDFHASDLVKNTEGDLAHSLASATQSLATVASILTSVAQTLANNTRS